MKISRFFFTISVFVLLFFKSLEVFSQSITFDNVPPFGTGSTAIGTNGGIVFNFTTNEPIVIETFRLASTASTNTATIWYNQTKINGQPVIANMNAAGGWIALGSATHTGLGNAALATIPVNCNLNMNPGDTFGFFIQLSGGNVFSNTTATPPTFSNGTVSIIADATCGFTRNATTWFGPTRQLNGGVIYRIKSKGGNNASISQLVSAPKFCGTNQALRVKVANKGINPISNVMINWAIDGLAQTPISLITLLDTLNHPINKNDTNITLGNITYTPNITKRIDVWTSMPNGVADTITSNDSLTVFLRPGLNGTYTIASTSADFSSLGTAINVIDSFGKCGPVTFNVIAGEVFTSTPITLSNLDSITFQKFGVGANPLVYGVRGIGATDAVFKISGSKNILFDGIDAADSVSNAAATSQMEYGYSILNSSGVNGSSNNTIKNCRVTLNRSNTATFGILQSASTTGGGVAATSLTGANHNNRYENVKIQNTYKGIGLIGTAGFPDSNCVITSTGADTTIIGAITANDIGNGTALVYGISAADQKNVEISKCWVRNLTHTGTLTNQGIFIDNGSTTTDYGIARVWGNVVYNINRTTSTSATGTVHGIRIDASTTSNAVVYNNVVYAINNISTIATATANQMVRGISFGTTSGTGTASFFYNSVSLNSSGLNNSIVSFWKGGTGNVIVRNNIFSNTSPAQTGVSKHYAAYISAGTILSSNNVFWSPNANGFVGFAAASDRNSLPAFAAAITALSPSDGNEQGSANANPNFVSSTDLTLGGITPAVQSGLPILSPIAITTDIAGNARSATNGTTIGAYESLQALNDSAAPIISNVVIINSALPTVMATITDNSNPTIAGSVRLWYRLGSSGAFTDLAPDSIPSAGMNGTYKWSTSLSLLSSGLYQFYISARDVVGTGRNIAVNPIQAAAFTGFSTIDPANYLNNPDAGVNIRTFVKAGSISGGTYQVGSSSFPYLKLTDVANALNSSQLLGNVIFELQSSYDGTTGEVLPITFNQLNTLGGNWTVTIRPAAGVTGRETSGYPASTAPVISLDGADRIVFDGRPGGVGATSEWTIKSKRTAASSNSPCFQFINGAQNDSLLYLKLESGNTTTTSGTVLFSTTNISVGNSFNVISNCDIRDRSDSTGNPAVAVYSAGTSGFTNDSIYITNNSIYNWLTSGIQVTATGNGAGWRISNNNFYMTSPQTTAQTSIRFLSASAKNVIENNFIGGSTINAGGAAWTNSGNIAWRGIVANTSQSDSSFIRNNTIQNIALTGTGSGTYGGIELTGGLNSVNNNLIGNTTSLNSIQSSLLGTQISLWSNGTTNIPNFYNNTIANITSTGNTTAVGHNGIRITSSLTAGALNIKGNTIFGLSAVNPTVSISTASMVGILTLSPSTLQTIANNLVYDLSASGGPANNATTAIGINVDDAASVGNITANRIYNIKNNSANIAAKVFGINLTNGATWNVTNNMVGLGSDITNDIVIVGINDSIIGTLNLYNNTVLISGLNGSAVDTSYAYRRFRTSNLNSRNNILGNIRTSSSLNYASAIYTIVPTTTYKANYNTLYTSTINVGLWLGVNRDFSDWKFITQQDTNSVNTAATFVSNTNLHITSPTVGNINFAGRPILGVTTDFDGETRDFYKPYMGADEITSSPLPVKLTSFNGEKFEENVKINWTTSTEINSNHFVVEFSNNGKNFIPLSQIKAKGQANTLIKYNYIHNDVKEFLNGSLLAYYRLKMVDKDGTFETSNTIVVRFDNVAQKQEINCYPNPFENEINLTVNNLANSGLVEVSVIDVKGSILFQKSILVSPNQVNTSINELNFLSKGVYFMKVKLNEDVQIIKLIKH